MNTKKPRRKKLNLVAQAKVFQDHRVLFWARSYDQYEAEKQEYLETGIFVDHDPTDELMRFWPLLDSLIQLPNQPQEDEFKRIAYSKKIYDLIEEFKEIENIYLVLKRSIDFKAVASKQIDTLLAKPRKKSLDRNLLTVEQKAQFRSLAFDVELWADPDKTGSSQSSSLVQIYLSIQDEIDTHGAVSDAGQEKLKYLKTQLAGTKRQRLYAESALVMMLAELYEQKNDLGRKSVVKRDPFQTPKGEYDSLPEENKDHDSQDQIIPWSPAYVSPFFWFLNEFQEVFEVERIGMANAEQITKNRKKLKSKKVLHLCRMRNGTDDFVKLFQILDRVKP